MDIKLEIQKMAKAGTLAEKRIMGGMIIPILMKNWKRFLNVRNNSGSTDDLNDWVQIPKSVKLVSRS